MKLTIFSIALAGLIVGGLFTYQQNRPDFHLEGLNETLQDEALQDALREEDAQASMESAEVEGSPVIEMESASKKQDDTPEVTGDSTAKM